MKVYSQFTLIPLSNESMDILSKTKQKMENLVIEISS